MRSLASALVLGLTAACTPIQLHMGVSPELLAKGRALEAPIVVLQHETSHHLVWREYHWDVVVEEHKVILLNSDGVADAALGHVPYAEGVDLVRLEARVHFPDGRVRDVSAADMFDHEVSRSAGEEPIVVRSVDFAYPEAVRGSVVEFHYAVTYPIEDLNVVQYVPDLFPTLSSRHVLQAPSGKTCSVRQSGYAPAAERRTKNDIIRELVRAEPVEVLAYEPHPELPGLRQPWLNLKCEGFGEIARFILKMEIPNGGSAKLPGKWDRMLKRLRDTRADDVEAIQHLPRTKTPTTALGDALEEVVRIMEDTLALRTPVLGWYRDDMKDVLKRGIGGEVSASRLLMALLQREGIGASLVFVPDAHMPDPTEDDSWREIFGGRRVVLVESEQGTWWLDPTCRGCPLGLFDPDLQGRGAVAFHLSQKVGQAGAELIEVPWQWAPQGELEQHLTLSAGHDSLQVVEGTARIRGRLAASLRINGLDGTRPRDELDDAVRQLLGVDPEAGSLTLDGLEDRHGVLIAQLRDAPMRARGYVATPARTWFSLAELFPIPELEVLGPKRRGAVRFETRPAFVRELTLRLEPGQRVVTAAPDVDIEGPMGKYHRTVEQLQGQLHIKERFTLEPRRVPIERYAALRAFIDEVLAARRTPFGIEREAP